MTAVPWATIAAKDLSTAVLVILVIIWIIFRLMQAHSVTPVGLIIVPGILAYFGLDNLTNPHTAAATVIFGVAIVVEIGIGGLIGRTYRMWRDADGHAMAQGTKATLWIWGLAFVVRIVMVAVEQAIDGGISDVSGVLVTLAAAFAGQNIVVAARAGLFRPPSLPSGPGEAPPDGATPL